MLAVATNLTSKRLTEFRALLKAEGDISTWAIPACEMHTDKLGYLRPTQFFKK